MTPLDWVLTGFAVPMAAATWWYRWGGQDWVNMRRAKRATHRHPSGFGTGRVYRWR